MIFFDICKYFVNNHKKICNLQADSSFSSLSDWYYNLIKSSSKPGHYGFRIFSLSPFFYVHCPGSHPALLKICFGTLGTLGTLTFVHRHAQKSGKPFFSGLPLKSIFYSSFISGNDLSDSLDLGVLPKHLRYTIYLLLQNR